MKRARIPFALGIATVMILSTYFGAVAAAPIPSPVGPTLVLYNRDSTGEIVPSTTNVFGAGEEVWVGIPAGSSSPYALTANSVSGQPTWKPENGSQPVNGLIPLSLSPSSFTAENSYVISLGVHRQYSPGFMSPQTSSTAISVTPSIGTLSLSSYSSLSNTIQTRLVLQDQNANPLTGVRLGLFLVQGNSTLQLTSDKTDLLGSLSLYAGESLAAGTYSFEVKVLDSNSVFSQPLLLPKLTINPMSTTISAWTPAPGTVSSVLLKVGNLSPIQGRLLVLERRLRDGNWTITSEKYTDNNGSALFLADTTSTLRVSFNGDNFYAAAKSVVSNSTVMIAPASATISGGTTSIQSSSLASQTGLVDSTFNSNTFSNGHITLTISTSGAFIYDPQGQALLARLSWQVQYSADTVSWQNLPWDGPFSMSMSDSAGLHQVLLQGTAGNDQVAVSMFFQAKPTDVLFTPIQMPVDLEALRGSYSYRIIWHLEGISASYFQFEQRTGDQRAVVHGPVSTSSVLTQSPVGENSMVALGADMKTVLFGLNWDNALRYYQGTILTGGSSGVSASIQFGSVTLSAGKHWIIPSCPCPDGGGGGGGGPTPLPTSTRLILPSSAYATINNVLTAQVKNQTGQPINGGIVNFYRDGSLIAMASLNSTGYASLVWTPGVTGSHTINATYLGNCCNLPSSTTQTLTINQTPTTLELLNPQQIAYSWDLYNQYFGNGLPIVVPVNILTLAPTNNTVPANIYMPAYGGPSSTPVHISGYGWAGLNLTSTVNVTVNGTSPETLNMNWTRNFYLPSCSNPPNCATTPRNGHLYVSATLTPSSTLYASSTTTSNIPYQNVNSLSSASGQISQTATPPQHLYINVNSTYPYVSVMMQNVPVALAAYNAYLAYSLGGPLSSYVSNGYTYFQLPAGSDFVYVCTDSTCNSPASNIAINLYDLDSHGNLVNCGTYWTTDYRGIVNIDGNGTSCGSPYAYAGIYTNGGSTVVSELFQTEAKSNPSPFYTNFQGYNYATFAPQKTGRYLLHMYTIFTDSAYTVLYPSISYPDVQYPNLTCCDLFLTVEKHPLQVQTSFNPATASIRDNVNATIQLNDLAASKPLSYSQVSYTLTRNTPNPASVQSGSLTTNVNGTTTLQMGLLPYGNYTLSLSRSSTMILSSLSGSFNFVVYRALPTLIMRDVSALSSVEPGMIKYVNPGGSASTPSIVNAQLNPYEFYAIVGTSTDIFNSQSTASISVSYQSYCPTCSPGSNPNTGTVVSASWAGGQPHGAIACSQSAFNICSQNVTRLTGTSNICQTAFCYRFSALAGTLSAINYWWVNINVQVCDSSGNCAKNVQDWGFVHYTDGTFLVDGSSVRHSDASTPIGTSVSFQFNATNSPSAITSVSLSILNLTASTTKTLCLIGGTNCLQPYQSTTASFLLYSPNTIIFTPGSYILTGTFTCPGCAQTTIQVLSLVLIISQTAWSENALVRTPYFYETSLVNNATGAIISSSGLTEKIYVNGAFATTLQTDANGNGLFTWTPQVAGQYTIKATLPGQSYYTNSSTTIMVSVTRRNVLLAISSSPSNPNVNQLVTWNVYAQDMISNSSVPSLRVSMFINGVNTTTVQTGTSGSASFTHTFAAKGSYNVTFVSTTNGVYNSATNFDPLTVLLPTTLTLQGSTITIGQSVSIPITLMDANGNPLTSRVATIKINSIFYANLTTDNNGKASLTWQPNSVANYTIAASYSPGTADFGYGPSSANAVVIVVPKTVINSETTGNNTQSVAFTTAQGTTTTSGFGISVTFPSLGWTNLNVQLNGKAYTGTLHIWNELGASCVTSFYGACVMWAPFWRVHFNENTNINGGSLSLVTDFFSGAIQSSTSSFYGTPIPIDPNSFAFSQGQNAANAAFTLSVATYLGIILGSVADLEATEPLAAPAAVAVLLGFSLGTGLAAFLAFKDKASRMNYLGGELLAVGLGVLGKYLNLYNLPTGPCDWPCIPLLDIGWTAYWGIVGASSPWGRVVLLTGFYGLILAILEVLLLVSVSS